MKQRVNLYTENGIKIKAALDYASNKNHKIAATNSLHNESMH